MNDNNIEKNPHIQALLTLHHGLPRGGPGSDRNTLKALSTLPGLPDKPRVIDLGCGPGKQTLVLAEKLGVKITAVDFSDGFLDQLMTDARERGLGHLIEPLLADLNSLAYPANSWDLIWWEGAIFATGFEKGLKMCRPWLGRGGLLAVSECTWLKPGAPREVLDFWETNYPAMMDLASTVNTAQGAGYDVLDHFILEDEDWLQEYWAPMRPRLDELEGQAEPDSALAQVVTAARREIALFEKYSQYYGYVFYLMRVSD